MPASFQLYETRGNYAFRAYDPERTPKRKHRTLRTKNKRVAQRLLGKLEQAYSRGEYDPWHDPVPEKGVSLTDALERYVEARSNRASSTLRADRSVVESLAEELPPGATVEAVEERHLEDFLFRDELTSSSAITYYTRLNAFFSWTVKQGMRRMNPMKGLERPQRKRKERRFLTRQQVDRLLQAIEADITMKSAGIVDGEESPHTTLRADQIQWLPDVIRLAVGTGMRRSELVAMRWGWVSLSDELVTVRNSKRFQTKSGHERSIPVRGEALNTLRRLHEERTSEADGYVFTGVSRRDGTSGQLSATYVSKRFKKYARLARLPEDVTFHTLRHTYVSWLMQQGVPPPVVQRLAGHADISTTMRYAHLQPSDLSQAIERVFG